MKKERKQIGNRILLILLGEILAGSAFAQESENHRPTLEEVLVTADRRGLEKNIQDLPMTIAAFSSDQLDNAQIERIEDLQFSTPGLTVSWVTESTQIFVRGVGTNVFGLGADNSVATYIDGVYNSRQSAANKEFIDVQRVEVLKGPQAILYGRNATGGAINIVSAEPTEKFTFLADGRWGNYSSSRYRASVSGPLGSPDILGRISAQISENSGYSENLLPGGDDYDRIENNAVKGAIKFLPTDMLDITLRANYFNSNGTGTPVVIVDPNASYFTIEGGTYHPDPRRAYRNIDDISPIDEFGAGVTVHWDIEWATLTSISAYNDHETGPTFLDLDDVEIDSIYNNGSRVNSSVWSQEFILRSNTGGETLDGTWEWLAGASYYSEDAEQNARFDLSIYLPDFPFPLPPFLEFESLTNLDSEAYAVFGEATYHFSNRLSGTFGVRYSDEEKEIHQLEYPHALTFPPGVTLESENRKNWNNVSIKLGFQYFYDEDIMFYASYEEGFKSGGYNIQDVDNDFDQEEVESYHIGMKSEYLNGQVRWNVEAYYYDYTDMQLSSIRPEIGQSILFIDNAGSSTIMGIETEFVASPATNLELGLILAYNNAEFDKGTTLVNAAKIPPGSTDFTPYEEDVGGTNLPKAPEWSGSIYGRYTFFENEYGVLSGNVEYYQQSEMTHDIFKTDLYKTDRTENLNASLNFVSGDGHWTVSLWGRNLTDDAVVLNVAGEVEADRQSMYAPPRTYGLEIAYQL